MRTTLIIWAIEFGEQNENFCSVDAQIRLPKAEQYNKYICD